MIFGNNFYQMKKKRNEIFMSLYGGYRYFNFVYIFYFQLYIISYYDVRQSSLNYKE